MEKDKSLQALMNKRATEHTFSERLKSIRLSKNLTQKQLAEMAGITAATLSAYENGAKAPVISTAAEIAKNCGVTLDWLCGLGQTRKIEDITHSEIIQQLIKLSNMTPISVSVVDRRDDPYGNIERVGEIDLSNPVIAHFIEEWAKVKRLFDDKIINRSIYDPWIAQQLIDYDCSTDEVPQKLEDDPITDDDDGELPF